MRRFVLIIFALALFAACARERVANQESSVPEPAAPPFKTLEPATWNDFELEIRHISTTTTVNQVRKDVDVRLNMMTRFMDRRGGRLVSVGHAIQWDEVRDERGRDLIALAVTPRGNTRVDEVPATFPMFIDEDILERGDGFRYTPSGWIAGLPDVPKALSVLRGHAQGVIADSIRRHEFALEPIDKWIEVADGLSFQIQSATRDGQRVDIRYRTHTTMNGDRLDEAQRLRWYSIAQIRPDGSVHHSQSAMGGTSFGESGTGGFTIFASDDELAETKIRLSVLENLELFEVPFAYHDVPLQ